MSEDLKKLIDLINENQSGKGTYVDYNQLKVKEIKSLDDTIPEGSDYNAWNEAIKDKYNTEITLIPKDSDSPYKEKKIKYNRIRIEKYLGGKIISTGYIGDPTKLESYGGYDKESKTLPLYLNSSSGVLKLKDTKITLDVTNRAMSVHCDGIYATGTSSIYITVPFKAGYGYAPGACLHMGIDPFGRSIETTHNNIFYYDDINQIVDPNGPWHQGNISWYYDQALDNADLSGLPAKTQIDIDRNNCVTLAGFTNHQYVDNRCRGIHHRTFLIELPNTKRLPSTVLAKGSLSRYINYYNKLHKNVYSQDENIINAEYKKYTQYCGNIIIFPEDLEYIEDGALLDANPIVLVINAKFQGFLGYKTRNHILATLRKIYYPQGTNLDSSSIYAKFFTTSGGIFTPGQADREFSNRDIILTGY